LPAAVLAGAGASRAVVQDFRPLADSIEWDLGQRYLRERGNKAFITDPEPVPFAINNDGTLSQKAAEVLFTSLTAAEQAGTLESEVFVLELGLGVGLFARLFLDAFRRLCVQHGRDYYDRLCYVAGDYSEKMLLDACRHGIFANHPGHYLLRVVDALCPERGLAQDPALGGHAGTPFRAVFLNYLLDCLPAAVLRIEGDNAWQLCVRTCLARGTELKEHTSLTLEELTRLANSADPRERGELLAVFDLLASEYAYQPIDLAGVPLADFAMRFARSASLRSVLHNYGALLCLERVLPLVRDQGFILITDYGHSREAGADDFQHQRFSHSTFIGINFPLVKAYFASTDPSCWIEPAEGDDPSIYARLMGRQVAPETAARFRECFGKTTQDWLHEPVQRARTLVQGGRFEAALTAYQQALERQPQNWVLMNEVAHFLTFSLRSPAAGLEIVKAALACNPSCSAELWNMLGDSLFALGRLEESRQAFLRALRVNADDVRARYNLAYVHARTREYAWALQRIAEALALDRRGTYREGLLQKQSEVLGQLTQRQQQESLRITNRISTRPDLPVAGENSAAAGLAPKIDRNQGLSGYRMAGPSSVGGTDQRPR
jgi:tetratricopeptide (TPR) repeat protein